MKSKSLWLAFLASAALIAQAKTTVDDWVFCSYTVTPRDTTPPGVLCPDAIGCDGDAPEWGAYAPNDVHVLYTPLRFFDSDPTRPCHGDSFIGDVHHSKLLVWLGGGNSKPNQKEYDQIYKVAASRGYHVIGLSYFDANMNGEPPVPGIDSCRGDLDCYGAYMKEVVLGTNCGSPSCDKLNFEHHPQDTINNRLIRVLQWAAREYPDHGWEAFLVGYMGASIPNWKLITIAGFSNGSSYAAYLGLQHPNVNRVALLNGPNDGAKKSRIWKVADYLKKQPGLTDTRYYALIHYLNHEDELYKQIGVYNALGMEGWTIFDPEPNLQINPSGGPVTDFNGAHVLLSIDSKTPPEQGHISVVRDEYKDHNSCAVLDPPSDVYNCTIGYEEAWRYIIGDGRSEDTPTVTEGVSVSAIKFPSPDGRFALRVAGLKVDLIEKPTGKVMVDLGTLWINRDYESEREEPLLVWSADSKWLAYGARTPVAGNTTVYFFDGSVFKEVALPAKLPEPKIVPRKGDSDVKLKGSAEEPLKWISPGELQISSKLMGVGRDAGFRYTGSIVITIAFDARHHASVKKVTGTKTEVSGGSPQF